MAPTTLTPTKPPVPGSAKARTVVHLAALAAISVVSRLPQLRSPNLLADGDECVLGLMAKHVAQGKEFPVFFYGQHYALSSVEAAAGALGFLGFGVSAVSLKLAMLALWTVGVLFLFLAQARLLGPHQKLLDHVGAPAQSGVGGLVDEGRRRVHHGVHRDGGAAVAAHEDRARETVVRWLVAGALTAVIYLAQPLWLPGLLPILARGSGLAASTVLGNRLSRGDGRRDSAGDARDRHRPRDLGRSPDRQSRSPRIAVTRRSADLHVPDRSYYLSWAIEPPGRATIALAIVWCIVLPAILLIQGYRLLTKRYCPLSHLLFVSIGATLVAEWALLSARDARYLLPLGALFAASPASRSSISSIDGSCPKGRPWS